MKFETHGSARVPRSGYGRSAGEISLRVPLDALNRRPAAGDSRRGWNGAAQGGRGRARRLTVAIVVLCVAVLGSGQAAAQAPPSSPPQPEQLPAQPAQPAP